MGRVEKRLEALGLELPSAPNVPPGFTFPFQWVRVWGRRAFISGHGALSSDGRPVGPFGRVPSEVSLEDARTSARMATLSMLASLQRTIGDLDNVAAWLTVNGFVTAEPSYPETTLVMNAASELLLDLYGEESGAHARTGPGVAGLPFNLPVILSAEIELAA